MSDSDDGNGVDAVEEEPTPLQRAFDLLIFAPVGIALTVAEDLPGLIGKGHQRFEADVQNARVVGRIVVAQGQRQFVNRLSKLLHLAASDETEGGSGSTQTGATQSPSGATTAPSARPGLSPRPHADPADGVTVEGALAGYDTLSASQVVRRLESLGPDELTALQRYEASHRNRHTILNRAHQILATIEATGEAVDEAADEAAAPNEAPPEGGADEGGADEGGADESGAPPADDTPGIVTPEPAIPGTTPTPASPPPAAQAPEPDRPVE